MELTGRVVLITGSRRIGAVVAAAVARRGADVALVYNQSAAEAEAAAQSVRTLGRQSHLIQGDVSDPDSCSRVVAETESALGSVDVLVNMASLYRRIDFDALTPDDWNRQLAVDLGGSFFCSKAAADPMRRRGGGRIINVADWTAAGGRPRYLGYLPYYVAKAGVVALTEGLALELAKDRILVNAVAPGPILPPPDLGEEEKAAVVDATPLKRWGGPEEIAKVVLAFIDSDFVTGETVRVDGGRHLL